MSSTPKSKNTGEKKVGQEKSNIQTRSKTADELAEEIKNKISEVISQVLEIKFDKKLSPTKKVQLLNKICETTKQFCGEIEEITNFE